MDDIKIRLRRGFGGIVPAICDDAANMIEGLQNNDRLMHETNCKLSLLVDRYRGALERIANRRTNQPDGLSMQTIAKEALEI